MKRLFEIEKVFCKFGDEMGNLNHLENFIRRVYGLELRKLYTDEVLVGKEDAVKVIGIETYEEWEKTYNRMKKLETTYKNSVDEYKRNNPGKTAIIIKRGDVPTIWGVEEDKL